MLVLVYGLQNEEYYCWSALVSLYGSYSSYNEELVRSVSIRHTDCYDSYGSYGPYEPTALTVP